MSGNSRAVLDEPWHAVIRECWWGYEFFVKHGKFGCESFPPWWRPTRRWAESAARRQVRKHNAPERESWEVHRD